MFNAHTTVTTMTRGRSKRMHNHVVNAVQLPAARTKEKYPRCAGRYEVIIY